MDVAEPDELTGTSPSRCQQLVNRVLEQLVLALQFAPRHWMRFEYFFQVFDAFAALGAHQRGLLMQRSMIARLGDIFLGPDSPLLTPRRKVLPMGSRYVASL